MPNWEDYIKQKEITVPRNTSLSILAQNLLDDILDVLNHYEKIKPNLDEEGFEKTYYNVLKKCVNLSYSQLESAERNEINRVFTYLPDEIKIKKDFPP